MDEKKLRQLEKRLKVRVKTGCETCRIRRIKCDETKPACNRCTKTGRTCDGYKHIDKAKKGSPGAAASFRNSSFLVVPQIVGKSSISINPSSSLSSNPLENRSFHYFLTHTLPRWTEFFESELWSQKVLQLSHSEPAIKHGILALSTIHERFEQTLPYVRTKAGGFAFTQYMQAVRHSNELLVAQKGDNVDLEKVLIACIIFTCYENLAGNYQASNMHLQNGLRILKQHKHDRRLTAVLSQDSIANVLYRFDFQAMTFSDSTSPYQYLLDFPPDIPQVRDAYKTNSEARDDLVAILRGILWISGIAEEDAGAVEHQTWLRVYSGVVKSFEEWETSFGEYQQRMPPHEQGDIKIYAGNSLLKIYAILVRVGIATANGLRSEMVWDPFVDAFRTMVDLAETLPILQPQTPTSSSRSSPFQSPGLSGSAKPILIAPKPISVTVSQPPNASTSVFRSELLYPTSDLFQPLRTSTDTSSTSRRAPPSFSPSFELSIIVPMFIAARRCRDPIIRRRAVALLLNSRRREGRWDSLGAGLVAAECLKKEEGLEHVDIPANNWIPMNTGITQCADVQEKDRVLDVQPGINLALGHMRLAYNMANGESWVEQRDLFKSGIVVEDVKGEGG